jgi:hypothetical protein
MPLLPEALLRPTKSFVQCSQLASAIKANIGHGVNSLTTQVGSSFHFGRWS